MIIQPFRQTKGSFWGLLRLAATLRGSQRRTVLGESRVEEVDSLFGKFGHQDGRPGAGSLEEAIFKIGGVWSSVIQYLANDMNKP